eukprot:gene12902-biopygen11205
MGGGSSLGGEGLHFTGPHSALRADPPRTRSARLELSAGGFPAGESPTRSRTEADPFKSLGKSHSKSRSNPRRHAGMGFVRNGVYHFAERPPIWITNMAHKWDD